MTSWKFYLFYNHCQLDHCHSKNHNLCCSKLILHPLLPIVSQWKSNNSSLTNPLFFSTTKSQFFSPKNPVLPPKNHIFPPKIPQIPWLLDPQKNPLQPLLKESPSQLGHPTRWPPWHRLLPAASLRPFAARVLRRMEEFNENRGDTVTDQHSAVFSGIYIYNLPTRKIMGIWLGFFVWLQAIILSMDWWNHGI